MRPCLKESLTSNPARGEQSKTVVDARYQAGVKGRLREFA